MTTLVSAVIEGRKCSTSFEIEFKLGGGGRPDEEFSERRNKIHFHCGIRACVHLPQEKVDLLPLHDKPHGTHLQGNIVPKNK